MITPLRLSLVVAILSSSLAQDGFVCNRPSITSGGFDVIEAVTGLEWCYDSDPVPEFILDTTNPLNLAALKALTDDPAVAYDAGYGNYIWGNGIYQSNIYIYEKDCKEKDDSSSWKWGKDWAEKWEHKSRQRGCKGRGMPKSEKLFLPTDDCSSGKTKGCILVDAPVSFGDGLGEWVRSFCESKGADLEVMILTHEHFDHIGYGNSILEANPTLHTTIANEEVAHVIESWRALKYDKPIVDELMGAKSYYPQYEITHTIEETEDLVVGNQTIQIRSGDGHTPGGLLLWHEPSKVLTAIDALVFPKWSPFFDLAISANIPELYKLFDIFREYDYELLVGGHLTHIGTPEDVVVSEEYAIDLLEAASRALFEFTLDPDSTASLAYIFPRVDAANTWLIFQQQLNQVALFCADIVLDETKNYSGKKWIETLGAVRVTVYSHCRTLADSLRDEMPGAL